MCNTAFANVYLNWVMYLSSTSFTQHQQLVYCTVSSVQFSHSFVSDSLQPHALQCARPFPRLVALQSNSERAGTRGGWGEDVFPESGGRRPSGPDTTGGSCQGLGTWVSVHCSHPC